MLKKVGFKCLQALFTLVRNSLHSPVAVLFVTACVDSRCRKACNFEIFFGFCSQSCKIRVTSPKGAKTIFFSNIRPLARPNIAKMGLGRLQKGNGRFKMGEG